MSFQKAASGKPQTIQDKINSFQNDVQKLNGVEDKITLRNMNSYNAIITNLERRVSEIQKELQTYQGPDASALRALFGDVSRVFSERKAKIQPIITDRKKQQEEARNAEAPAVVQELTQEQLDQEELEFVAQNAREIKNQMHELNIITHQVDEEIQRGHATLVRIDEHIEEAKTEMQEGNKDLEKAEDHQKKTCNVQ